MQPGTRLDHYEIVDLLGEGGMGAVYRVPAPPGDRFLVAQSSGDDGGASSVRAIFDRSFLRDRQ